MVSVDEFAGTTQPDDAGSTTYALFDWQAAAAAVDGLAQLAIELQETQQQVDRYIICEHHEDYACITGDNIELVSVKHREQQSGAWTWATLASQGGLLHLFGRWQAFDGKFQSRIVTNSGLKTGDVGHLPIACDSARSTPSNCELDDDCLKVLHKLCKIIASDSSSTIPLDWRNAALASPPTYRPFFVLTVRNFMAGLTIDHERPHRKHILAAAPRLYVTPVLRLLDIHIGYADACWEAVLGLFRTRMQSLGDTTASGLDPVLSALLREGPPETTKRTVRRRRVSVSDIQYAIDRAVSSPAAYEIPSQRQPITVLSLKVEKGGCSSTTIEAAEEVAQSWRKLKFAEGLDVPGGRSRFLAAERKLQIAASLAADDAISEIGEHNYGRRMWRILTERLHAADYPDLTFADDALLLGGVCDLASRCKVWFSRDFDLVEARERKLRELEGGAA